MFVRFLGLGTLKTDLMLGGRPVDPSRVSNRSVPCHSCSSMRSFRRLLVVRSEVAGVWGVWVGRLLRFEYFYTSGIAGCF